MMKAFIVERYGSKDGVRAGDMPEPELREDDVLVQIHAAGVNLLDAKIRDGEFKRFLPYRFPLILGNEVAGVVVRVGSRVQRFKPGDEIYARPDTDRIGAFAECIAIQEDAVAKKPKNLTMEESVGEREQYWNGTMQEKVTKESLSKEENYVDVSTRVGNHSRGNGACSTGSV